MSEQRKTANNVQAVSNVVANIEQPKLPSRVFSKLKPEVIEAIERKNPHFDFGQLQTLQFLCNGKNKCPYRQDCPFDEQPVGERCQLELYYQEKWLSDYLRQFGISQTEKTLLSIVVSLVTVDIQLMRQQSQLQQEGFEQYIFVETEDGNKKVDKKLHNLLSLVDTLERRKISLIKQIKEDVGNQQTQKILGSIVDILPQH